MRRWRGAGRSVGESLCEYFYCPEDLIELSLRPFQSTGEESIAVKAHKEDTPGGMFNFGWL